ncbi:MAG: ATP-binding cassette domain-containing protein [Pseudonocardiaceae bacterium]
MSSPGRSASRRLVTSGSPFEKTAVAERALVTEFADHLPEGLGARVGERGAALSGGQRQRIALARVLLREAPVLVLDEAVSNVDAEGETHLRRTLDSARQGQWARAGRTTLVIAHRLSTIRTADRVVVLEGGRVVQEGRHEPLAATDGPYRQLLASQVDLLGDRH